MPKYIFFIIVNVLYSLCSDAYAANSGPRNLKYVVCFTPGEDCTKLIVGAIEKATSSIKLQAYSFTSVPIAQAIINAKDRGVDVRVILDKSQFSENYSVSKFLLNQNVPVWKDHRVTIAHNKVIVIDEKVVITGSFNFTKAAQEKNAENVLIITDSDLARKYSDNWKKRMAFSDQINTNK